jgi:uncharacterized protein (TIGR00369 family)
VPDDNHYSGSPFLSLLETHLEDWRDGYARISIRLKAFHVNRSGVVHGGVLAALLDHAGGMSGLHCTVPGNWRYGMTLSLTSNYIGQARAGTIVATGTRVSGGRKVYFANAEVRTDGGVVLATGTGVYRYRGGSETPEGTSEPPWAKRDG